MYYLNPNNRENGSYAPPQTVSIDGFLQLPDDLLAVFVEYNGFVNLTVEGEIITAIEPNTGAWEAWKATLPEPSDPESVATDTEVLNTLLGVSE